MYNNFDKLWNQFLVDSQNTDKTQKMNEFQKWRSVTLYHRTLKNGSKQYYVSYYFWSPRMNEFIPLRKMKGINLKHLNNSGRYERGIQAVEFIKELFKKGVIPEELRSEYPSNINGYNRGDSIQQSIQAGIASMKPVFSNEMYTEYKNRLNKFSKWTMESGYSWDTIKEIKVADLSLYLTTYIYNKNGEEKGQVNRNNHRSALVALYKILVQNDVLNRNIAEDIPKLKEMPTEYKPYTEDRVSRIKKVIKESDRMLFIYVLLVEYQFMRSIECSRLKCEHVYIEKRLIKVLIKKGRSFIVQYRSIPDVVHRELSKLDLSNPNAFIFDRNGICESETKPESRRNSWQKRYKKVLIDLELTKKETIQTHRHTGVVRLMNIFRERGLTKAEAELKALEITGHTSLQGLRRYLSKLIVWMPQDYSWISKDA